MPRADSYHRAARNIPEPAGHQNPLSAATLPMALQPASFIGTSKIDESILADITSV